MEIQSRTARILGASTSIGDVRRVRKRYFQPASRRFFSHTPNTPNCATQ